MTLRDAIERFIASRRALGTRFRTETDVLMSFLKRVDGDVGCDAVTRAQACAFLAGNGRLTRTRALKYSVLTGFYSYAISHGFALCSPLPLPEHEPRKPPARPPYVFTREELRRLLDAVRAHRRRCPSLDRDTFRTLLLLLYGAGLRTAEARHLTVADVDLSDAVLTVRVSKFYKSRLVPVGPQLVGVLRAYAKLRATRPYPHGKDSCFLAATDGTMLARGTVLSAFLRLRRQAGIRDPDGPRLPPGLHSLRHTFAVHRLIAWYRQGADVQRLLPVLSIYLGHARLADTQIYLSMTPELLEQASMRFERYAMGPGDA